MSGSRVRVGLLGCGTVGSALVALLADQTHNISVRTGLDLEIVRVAVRDPAKERDVALPREVFTSDAVAVVIDPNVDIVVELIGGIEPARELVLAAIKQHKPVVTANKALLASHGAEIFARGEENAVDVLFEAAVAGGVPIVRPLRESLLVEPVERVLGIVNGTTNFILTKMAEEGADYEAALAEAQALGYAEADPTADVGGQDAAAKLAILATIAFGVNVVAEDVYCEGITNVTTDDIAFAKREGYVVKLLAVAEEFRGGPATEVGVRVHPVMVPVTHPLAAVRDSFNAVFVEGSSVGDLMFYGRGAGGDPTASAVLGDLVDAALNSQRQTHATMGYIGSGRIRSIDELSSEYYLSIDTIDRPGVLAAVASLFGDHQVSIASMEQEGRGDAARIVFITHLARERDMQATVGSLRELDAVRRVNSLMRVLGTESTV